MAASSRRKALEALNRLMQRRPKTDELFLILRSLRFGHYPMAKIMLPELTLDHTAAILGASILENILERAIVPKLVPLDDTEKALLFDDHREGPLSTFAAKIRMGHALGLYGPGMRDDLISVKSIRNLFAHARGHVDFNTKEIFDLCGFLTLLEKGMWSSALYPKPETPREQYLEAIMTYYLYLGRDPERQNPNFAWYWDRIGA